MVAGAGSKGAYDEKQWFDAMNGNALPLVYNSNSGALEGLANIPADTINGLANAAAWLSRKTLGTDFGHEQYSGVPRVVMPTMGADGRIESDMFQNFRRSQLDPNMGQSNAAWNRQPVTVQERDAFLRTPAQQAEQQRRDAYLREQEDLIMRRYRNTGPQGIGAGRGL